ncbi:MAG: hypothetical protein AAFR20_03460 [Pseudomonadota bacterium]
MRIISGFLLGAVLCAAGAVGYLYLKDEKGINIVPDAGITAPAPFDDTAFFADLKSSDARAQSVSETAIDTIIAALPDGIDARYDSVEVDGSNNTLLVRGLSITSAGEEKIGVRAEQARFWDLNGDGVAARVSGERLDDVIPVASRIDFSGVSLINGDALADIMVDAGLEAAEKVAGLFGQGDVHFAAFEDLVEFEQSLEMRVEKAVVTQLVLQPYVLSLIQTSEDPEVKINPVATPTDQSGKFFQLNEKHLAENGGDHGADREPIHMMQRLAAWSMAYSFDAMALYDTAVTARTASTYGGSSDFSYTIARTGYQGYDRGDVAVTVNKGTRYTSTASVPTLAQGEEDGEGNGDGESAGEISTDADDAISYVQSGETESLVLRDLRLRKIYDHLARGVWPDKNETDLFSLGFWHLKNDQQMIDGEPFYGTREFTLDLRHFHNVLPTHIDLNVDDFAINYVTYANFVSNFAGLVGAGDLDAGSGNGSENIVAQNIDKVVKILQDNELVDPALDIAATLNWDPGTGDYDEKSQFDLEDFITFKGSTAATLLPYSVLSENFSLEMTKEQEEALAKAFEETAAFKGLTYRLSDRGGIEKSFAIAVALAELFPGQPGTEMLIGAEPDDLRVLSATSLRLGAGSMAQAFPPAKEYILALADFISKGGTLIVKADPDPPVTVKMVEDLGSVEDPQAVVDLFGFSVTHKGSGTKGE